MSKHYIKDGHPRKPYLLLRPITYKSRYDKLVIVKRGARSDGATGAYDLNSKSWWIHDQLCETGTFADGTLCTNWQASTIIYDVLRSEGKWFRARTWFIATLAFGGGKARKNGIFRI